MTIECPFCGMGNAYCDGMDYDCPDCDRTWPSDEIPDDVDWVEPYRYDNYFDC